jgi:hypothetical protein
VLFVATSPNAVYMDIIPDPVRPPSELWHHYVECDDALHRIGRMTVLRGMNMFLGSQWFAIPKHVVQWGAKERVSLYGLCLWWVFSPVCVVGTGF